MTAYLAESDYFKEMLRFNDFKALKCFFLRLKFNLPL